MICIHHNKDMDGYTSGAIIKLRFPEAKLIGWDYKDEIPDFEQFIGEDVIMIDITFPLATLMELGRIARLTVIDHHISFLKQVIGEGENPDIIESTNRVVNEIFRYVYYKNTAACEIGWIFCFPNKPTPYGVTLIGRYDTWRQGEGDWEGETLPFKYYMYGNCNSAETFPTWVFNVKSNYILDIHNAVVSGKEIMKYQRTMDESTTRAYSFEREAYGITAICLNQPYFSSETVASLYDGNKHDIMVGFAYTGTKWSVSLRSIGDYIDCSKIARSRGGGGHKNAAGFEVKTFEEIWK